MCPVKSIALFSLIAFVLTGCQFGSESYNSLPILDRLDTGLEGKIVGNEWKAELGVARKSLDQLESYTITLFSKAEDISNPCTELSEREPRMTFQARKVGGIVSLNDSQSIEISIPSKQEKKKAQRGFIVLSSINANDISGRIEAKIDDQNFIKGTFKAIVCSRY